MAERATRQMLDGIEAFIEAYKNDPKFSGVIDKAKAVEEAAEKLVPAAYDKTADQADQPTNLKDAATKARQVFRAAKKADEKEKPGDTDNESSEK